MAKWDPDVVAAQDILEQALLKLSEELSKRIDRWHPVGEAMLRLSFALADYRDRRIEDRG